MHSGYHESKFVCGVYFPETGWGIFFVVVVRRLPVQSGRVVQLQRHVVVVAVDVCWLEGGWVARILFWFGVIFRPEIDGGEIVGRVVGCFGTFGLSLALSPS
jgi:hypothetical protein